MNQELCIDCGKCYDHCRFNAINDDGSPGIGCPVIASLSGSNMVILVTEPTFYLEHLKS